MNIFQETARNTLEVELKENISKKSALSRLQAGIYE